MTSQVKGGQAGISCRTFAPGRGEWRPTPSGAILSICDDLTSAGGRFPRSRCLDAVPAAPSLRDPPDARSRLILIAEKDRVVRELQQHFLGEAGFTCEFVENGQVALERARELLPELVITEILIGSVDGLTLCRRLREDPATRPIPVLVFSILAAAPRAQEAGATAYLRKPLVESSFIAAVREAVAAQPPASKEQQWAAR